MLIEKINEDNRRSTPSDRLFTRLQGYSVLLCAIMHLTSFICLLADTTADSIVFINVFGSLFYPIVIALILSFCTGLAQIFRQARRRNLFFLVAAILCVLILIAFIVYEVIAFGFFHLVPFHFL